MEVLALQVLINIKLEAEERVQIMGEIKKVKYILSMAMFVALLSIIFVKADVSAKKTVDIDGEYHAALGLQTDPTYNNGRIYRKAYYTNPFYGKDEWSHLAMGTYGDEDSYERLLGRFTDVKIKGNGKYTVSLKNADFRDAREFQLLQVATDIPNTGKIKFSDMKVEINGEEVASVRRPVLDKRKNAKTYACLQVINTEIDNLDVIDRDCVPSDEENSIKITFTVKGFSYNKGEKPPAKATPKPTATVKPQPVETVAPELNDKAETDVSKDNEKTASEGVSAKSGKKGAEEDVIPDEYETPVILVVIIISVIAIIGITVSVNQRRR